MKSTNIAFFGGTGGLPAKRLGYPVEISNTIKYMIDTEYLNGASINLSGGLL